MVCPAFAPPLYRAPLQGSTRQASLRQGFPARTSGRNARRADLAGRVTGLAARWLAIGALLLGALALMGCESSKSKTAASTSTKHTKYVYVADEDGADVWGFSFSYSTGTLTVMGGFPVATNITHPAQGCADPEGRWLYMPDGFAGTVEGWQITEATGALTHVPGSTFASNTGGAQCVVDASGRYLYVITDSYALSAFLISQTDGSLTPIVGSANADFMAQEAIATDAAGKYVFTTSADNESLSSFTISPSTGALTVHGFGTETQAAGDIQGVAVAPSGNFVYVADDGGRILATPVSNGVAQLASSVAVSAGFSSGLYLAITPNGRFLYDSNFVASPGRFGVFAVNTSTGALTEATFSPQSVFDGPKQLGLDPTSAFAFASFSDDDKVASYSINSTTGQLTEILYTAPPGAVLLQGPVVVNY
jgi:6-phosphogluconolactonase (cycloisomerase 2 family)